MTCPPCTHNCNEGRDCPLIAINAEVVGYVEPHRQWVGLTDKEMYKLWLTVDEETDPIAFGKAIEAKLKEKNT